MKRSHDSCNWRRNIFRKVCRSSSVGQCVYCNALFCEEHGVIESNYLEVCNKRGCLAKKEDVEMHLQWKLRVKVANEEQICAIENCDSVMEIQCSRCQYLFCKLHLKIADIIEFGMGNSQKIAAVLCDHCFARRIIWDQ